MIGKNSSAAGPTAARAVNLAVLVAALGYFVDIYDLILFSVIRVKSLQALGVTGPALLEHGIHILNCQMMGMLVGGVLWGILGDRRGRLSVLFGSIVLYSLANLANAVPDWIAAHTGGHFDALQVYAIVRFIAGVGLAGELGAGITLVSESMGRKNRGYGTTTVAAIGICGAVVAVLVGRSASWRTAYVIGAGMGFGLLVLRLGVLESGLFQGLRGRAVSRGNMLMLFTSWPRFRRYLCVILIGLPLWYCVGILVTFSPELGKALGMQPLPQAPTAVLAIYSGLALGDFASGFASQLLRSRKKAIGGFMLFTALLVFCYFTVARTSLTVFYVVVFTMGLGAGYWAVFVTVASEQFGTNIRATVTTTVPNFVRGSLVLITMLFEHGRVRFGIAGSAAAVGALTLVVACAALFGLDETYGKDLDYVET